MGSHAYESTKISPKIRKQTVSKLSKMDNFFAVHHCAPKSVVMLGDPVMNLRLPSN